MGPSSVSGPAEERACVLEGEDVGVFLEMRRGWIWMHCLALLSPQPAHDGLLVKNAATYRLRHGVYLRITSAQTIPSMASDPIAAARWSSKRTKARNVFV